VSTRLRIDLGYLGTNFSGWAIQPGLRTVQGSLEEALAIALRCDRSLITSVVAGRTDAGVHALHQVCHVEIPDGVKLGKLDSLLKRVQGTLRTDDIALHQISLAPEGFDARFSAMSRTYEYRIDDRGSKRNPLHHLFTYRSSFNLDDAAMNAVSQALCGLHDFAAFCRPKPGATTIRHLTHFAWTRDGDGILTGSVIADAFCHSMVRSLVGSAVAVGRGRLSVKEVVELRDKGQRTSAWTTMAAKGLTLISVEYPPDELVASRALDTRTRRGSTSD
jgi:tRNA pseudouridine38-40 synthase